MLFENSVASAFAGTYIPIMSPTRFSLWGCKRNIANATCSPFRHVLPSNRKIVRSVIGEGGYRNFLFRLRLILIRRTHLPFEFLTLHRRVQLERSSHSVAFLSLFIFAQLFANESFCFDVGEQHGRNYAFWLNFNALLARCSSRRCTYRRYAEKKASRDLKGEDRLRSKDTY